MTGARTGYRLGFLSVVVVLGAASMSRPASGQTMDKKIWTFVQADQLEYAPNGERPVVFDTQGWIGGDYNRLWVKAEGDVATTESTAELEVQALFSRLISPFWDFQAGIRTDARFGGMTDQGRALLVVGFQGLAPYWFELEPALFVSQDGDVSARLAASYDLLFTQRLVVQPDFELNAAVQSVDEWGLESGLTDLELGVRMRYEIRREFAPYIGFSWITLLGGTKGLARSDVRHTSDGRIVFGLRAWY